MARRFDFLNEKSFNDLYSHQDKGGSSARFYVQGLSCVKCVGKIENLAIKNPGLYRIDVSLADHTASVSFDPQKMSLSQIAQKITDLGFEVTPLKFVEKNDLRNQEVRRDLIRLGVAGFLAAQIMMLSFAIYFGLAGELKRLFEWSQWFLYLPIVTYVAAPFYHGFLVGIRQKQVSIDIPMAVASSLGFLISTVHLFKGEGTLYLDSTAGFLFLILATRMVQKSTRFRYLKFLRPTTLMEEIRVQRKNQEGGWNWVPAAELQIQDRILLQKNDICPVDGRLENESAYFDFSLLNGESNIKTCTSGLTIFAGAKLHSSEAELLVLKMGEETGLGQILAQLSEGKSELADSAQLTDRLSQWVFALVLLLGSAFMLSGLSRDSSDLFERGFALIILACPCALAFGTPLAMAVAMERAQRIGFIFKGYRAFEKLLQVKEIYFDKTGTLTKSQAQVDIAYSRIPHDELKELILSLEQESHHPIADSLRAAWGASQSANDSWDERREIPHLGIEGRRGQETYFFGRTRRENEWRFLLMKNSELLAELHLQFPIQSHLLPMVKNLQLNGFQVGMISGDIQTETERVGKLLGLPENRTFSSMTAQQKMQILDKHPHAMMIGDGVNDSLAMSHAHVSLAVHGSVDTAMKSADIFMINGHLSRLPQLFEVAKWARIQLKRNLVSALLYNFIGACLALSGLASPYLAALLMPASSLFILFSTLWGGRSWKFSS